jgi:ring-1,2-phenylacetyl-CoA epoxidase subunit PaaD
VWAVLATGSDPEIPVVSVVDLGIVREVEVGPVGVRIVITPTYAGCPATEVIRADITRALATAGIAQVTTETRLAPSWTTDWIAPAAREALRAYGIAPPCAVAQEQATLAFRPACPRCGSHHTELLSRFGATPCKALYRCLHCCEPFDFFKPL